METLIRPREGSNVKVNRSPAQFWNCLVKTQIQEDFSKDMEKKIEITFCYPDCVIFSGPSHYLSQPLCPPPTFSPSFANFSRFHPSLPNPSQAPSTNVLIFVPQDISHLLASTFEDLYTGDVIGEDIERNWIKSRGGDNVYHESFTEELQKLVAEYKCRLREADIVEENIIQAQDRAKAEEERLLPFFKIVFLVCFPVAVASSFRWIVNNELLRKNHLTCPDDYITDKLPVTRAPKGKSEPGYIRETFSSKQRVAGLRDQTPAKIAHLQRIPGSLTNLSLCTLTLSSLPDSGHQTKKTSKVHFTDLFVLERAYLAKLEKRQNYLKNPRFFPPNALHGGKSLVISQEKVEQTIARRKAEDNKGYAMTIELQNITSTCHHVRLIPPSTSAFAIGPGKFPGKGGMIAPGMTCQYTVQFIPEYLGDYEDCILVETQVSEPFLIPIQAKRPPPVLTLPHIIDCGSCIVGGIKVTIILCTNEGFSTGKFCIMPKKAWPPSNFRAVATAGFVLQDPFGIYPAGFELAPGQSTTVEVMFFPSLPEVSQQTYTIVCDNCQVNDVTVTGVGQLIALDLVFVTGGESEPEPGEATDVTAQHLIRFDPQNPHTTKEKKLVIRNTTYVTTTNRVMLCSLSLLVGTSVVIPSSLSWRNLRALDKLWAGALLLFALTFSNKGSKICL
uniref:DLEC1 cilia and flagella associated protein n=1 Tax=Calidris pygmaea TaxID=425635 RepID=A0A8C3K0N0_9CHAR